MPIDVSEAFAQRYRDLSDKAKERLQALRDSLTKDLDELEATQGTLDLPDDVRKGKMVRETLSDESPGM